MWIDTGHRASAEAGILPSQVEQGVVAVLTEGDLRILLYGPAVAYVQRVQCRAVLRNLTEVGG
jgi:hypothetical protein